MSTQEKVADPEVAKPAEAPPPKAEAPPPPAGPPHVARLLTTLRGLLFALTLIALLVMVFSKQTREDPFPGPFSGALAEAKFDNYPAFIYFVVAFSVACLYSIITALASISVVLKPAFSASFLLFFVVWDVVMLGLVASATGTAGGVAYIWLKGNRQGNSHERWDEFCNVYDKFCQHLETSIAVSILAALVLILLIILSILSLQKKIPQ